MSHIPEIGFTKSERFEINFTIEKCNLPLSAGMTALIFGIGIGLFLILTLWALAALVFLVSLKVEKKIGVAVILIVSICTVILISVPRASEKSTPLENKVYDRLFVWRVLLLVVLILSSVIGLAGYIKYELTDTVKPVRITKWTF